MAQRPGSGVRRQWHPTYGDINFSLLAMPMLPYTPPDPMIEYVTLQVQGSQVGSQTVTGTTVPVFAVPEPGSPGLVGVGLVGLLGMLAVRRPRR
jgi:hypothetical protein